MKFPAAQQYLDSFIDHEIHLGQTKPSAFKLERIQQLLQSLGDPHKDLKIIHVAGSKGKGSICALTASILQSAGYKVGLYTSPHMNNYRERIRILNSKTICDSGSQGSDIFPDCISEEELCRVIEETKPVIEVVCSQPELGVLSFFEVYTALALYHFQQRKTDFVVLETGLGGRLDATNATDSIVAAIAPINLEHTRILGDAISSIAQEKAAIIKDGKQKVVIALQAKEAQDVLDRRCRKFAIKPIEVNKHAEYENVDKDIDRQIFHLKTAKTDYGRLTLPLLGKHQRDNAATSVCIIECLQDLGIKIPVEAVQEGCKNIFWPGRFEAVAREPLVLLDGAHSPDSARALAETIKEIFKEQKVILILGISEDKNKKLIYDELSCISQNIIFTKADHPRAADLAGAVNVKEALDLAHKAAGAQDIILVAGSIFVISEARKLLTGDRPLGVCPLSEREGCIS